MSGEANRKKALGKQPSRRTKARAKSASGADPSKPITSPISAGAVSAETRFAQKRKAFPSSGTPSARHQSGVTATAAASPAARPRTIHGR